MTEGTLAIIFFIVLIAVLCIALLDYLNGNKPKGWTININYGPKYQVRYNGNTIAEYSSAEEAIQAMNRFKQDLVGVALE